MANGTYAAESSKQFTNAVNGGGIYSDRQRDYYEAMSGEIAADNAYKRQEDFFNAYQSPSAQIKLLKEAGLSPSIFASGGLPGGSGTSGVSGSGGGGNTGGTQAILGVMSAIKDISLMSAEISKTKAEIENTKADTNLKNAEAGKKIAETEYQNYINENQSVTNKLTNAYILKDPNDMTTGTSLFDIANATNSYSEYMKAVKEIKWGNEIQTLIHTENGQRVLRDIYINSKEQSANIAALNKQQTNDELALQILKVLNKEGYSELSAQEQIEALKRSIETNKLDKETGEAWNNLLEKLGNGTKQDTAIVIGLLLKTLLGQSSYNVSRSTIVK